MKSLNFASELIPDKIFKEAYKKHGNKVDSWTLKQWLDFEKKSKNVKNRKTNNLK